MKKIISILLIIPLLMGCELGSMGNSPDPEIIGTWKHLETLGDFTYKGQKKSLYSLNNGEKFTFKKDGICDCRGWVKYKISGNTITFTDSNGLDDEYTFKITGGDYLAIEQSLSQLRKIINDPSSYTSLNYYAGYEKQ